MKKIVCIFLVFLAFKSNAQTYQVNNQNIWFNGKIRIPMRYDTASYGNIGDSAAIVLQGKDSTVYVRYKGYWKNIAQTQTATWGGISGTITNQSDLVSYIGTRIADSLSATGRVRARTNAGLFLQNSLGENVLGLGVSNSKTTTAYGTISYLNNLGSSYTARSLTDKGYVDSAISSNAVDTFSVSTRAWRQKGIDSLAAITVKYTDTSTMLSPYLRKADTVTLSNRINLKLNISDTTNLLSEVVRTFGTQSIGGAKTLTGALNGTSASFSSSITANSFIKSGGTSSQFLKADGSVDGNSYALSSSLANYLPLSGGTLTGALNGTSASFSSSITATNYIGNWQGYTPSSFALASALNNYLKLDGSNSMTGTLNGTSAKFYEPTSAVNEQIIISNNGTYHVGLAFSPTSNYLTNTKAFGIYGGANSYVTGLTDAVAIALSSAVPEFRITSNTNLNSIPNSVLFSLNNSTGAATFSSSVTANSIVSNSTGYFSGLLTAANGFYSVSGTNTLGEIYIPNIYPNTINSYPLDDVDNRNTWINYTGYNAGFTRFRNLYIGDGKGVDFVRFIGSTKSVEIDGTLKLKANRTFFGSNGSDYIGIYYAYSGAMSRILTNAGASADYNGLMIETNYGNGGGLPSWHLDIGGYDGIGYSVQDLFAIRRQPNGGSYSTFFTINNSGAATFSSSVTATNFIATNSGASAFRMTNSSGKVWELFPTPTELLFFNASDGLFPMWFENNGNIKINYTLFGNAATFSSSVTATNFIGNWQGYTPSSFVPTSRTLTINGTTYDLSANRSWTVTPSGTFSLYPGVGVELFNGSANIQNLSSSPVYYLKEKLAFESTLQTNTTAPRQLAIYTPQANEQGVMQVIVSGFDGTTSDKITYTTKVFYWKSGAGTVDIYESGVDTESYKWGSPFSGLNVTITTSGGSIVVNVNGTNNGCYWTAYTRAYPNYPAN